MQFTTCAIFIMGVGFIALIISICVLLGYAHMLFGFDGETKETEATIIRYISRGHDDYGNPRSPNEIIEYYNEFQGKVVTKETLNSGLPKLKVGDKVKIQYTPKRERPVDERYIKPNRYKISKFIIPIVVSASVGAIGFFLLVISVIIEIL